jgi:hypothetical protein
MANEVFLNPALNLDSLFPTLNDESFLQFLKEYYKFLQSTKITLENVSGTFVKGETVVGFKTKAFGTILAVGENELIVLMKTETPLSSDEVLTGSTSGATGTITFTKDNVIRESARLQQARSQYVSGDEFFKLLQDEVNRGYPSTSEADRRALYNRIRDLLVSKSTEEAYRFLFKAFFDENVEIRFPGDDLLRVSDGKFEKTSLIRVVPQNTNLFPIGTIFDFLNKTIRGQTSGAVGTVVNIQISFLGGLQYAEFNLKLVSGEFEAGETIADVLQPRLSTQVFGVIGDIEIIDGGSGYSIEDEITITGDGAEATAVVSSISSGPINRILVNTPGYGYRINTRATVNNLETGGEGLSVAVTELANTYSVTRGSNTYILGDTSKISILNRGSGYSKTPTITLRDTTIQALGLLSERLISIDNPGEDYAVGDVLTFTGGAGANAAGIVASVGNAEPYGEDNILFEDDFVLLQEQEANGYRSQIKNEDWANQGPILRIELTNLGDNYTSASLPTITIEAANTVSGSNAAFTVQNIQGVSANVVVDIANNAVGIGSIRQINIIDPGINYSSANADVSTEGDGNAILEPVISGLSVNRGFFTNDDGKVNFKIIQDSFFFQDFSYVIRSGLIIDAYKELVKETVHPAGLEFFGEIVITSLIGLQAEFRSQIDQSPRPLALSSFVSLFPIGVSIPNGKLPLEIEIAPAVIDQALIGVNDFNIREIEITPATIDEIAEFKREIVNKLYLYIDVSLFPTFSDVVTGVLPSLPAEIDYVLAGATATISTDKEYQIEIAPIPMVQPLAVRGFNIREIEITPLADLAIEVERVKLQDDSFIADQYGETPISFFAEETISSLSSNTFLDFTGFETVVTRFVKTFDTQGLEVDIELYVDASLDIVFNDVQILDTSTSDVILKLEPTLIDQALIGVRDFNIRRIEIAPYIDMATQPVPEYTVGIPLYVNVALDIVFNDVSILETSISDVIVKLEPAVAPAPVSVRDFNIRKIDIVKNIELDAQTIAEYEIDVFTEAQTKTYFGDQLLATYAENQISEFENTKFGDIVFVPLRSNGIVSQSYEIDIELPLVTVAAIVQPFRVSVDRLRIPTLGLDPSIIDATVSFEGTSYEIEFLPQFVQFAPRVIPQDTGRVKTLGFIIPPVRANAVTNLIDSIRITPEEIDVAPIPRMKLEIDVPPGFASPFKEEFKDILISSLNNEIIETLQNQTFGDKYLRYQSLSRTDIDYRVEILLYIDSRMRFYSEILTMTNREATVELQVFSKINLVAVTPQEVIINYNITPSVIEVSGGVRNFNVREIEILPYIDSRMRFYSEILTMTNREATVEITIIAEKVNVSTKHGKVVTVNYYQWADVPISLLADETIGSLGNGVFIDDSTITVDSEQITSDSGSPRLNDAPGISFTRTVPGTVYEIDIEPVKSQVVSLFIPTEEHLGNTEREILLYIDSRMRFYSEILTMTNRESTLEIDVIAEGASLIATPVESIPINFGIVSLLTQPLAVTDFNIREIEITPATMDLRMAFYTEIYTMTNRVHTTEIEIQSQTTIAVESKTTSYEIDIETGILVSPRRTWGDEKILTLSENEIEDYASTRFNSASDFDSLISKEVIVNIQLPLVDATMAFYTEVLTLEGSGIRPTEIEIVSSIDISSEQVTQLKIDVAPFVVRGIQPAISEIVKNIELVSNEFVANIDPLPINRVIENEPLFVGLAQGELTLSKGTKLEVILGSKFKDALLSSVSNTPISELQDKTFESNIAIGAANFVQSYQLFGDTEITNLQNDPIENFEESQFAERFTNRNVSKNVFANGTVSFIDLGFAESRIEQFSGAPIELYENTTFEDQTGANTSVIGTNTEFTVDFRVGGTIITDTEKFLVTNIANNEYLEVNVNPEENYIDASVYREYFV